MLCYDRFMKTIKTIDLWTEQFENHYECFNGCFIDGFDNEDIPFESYKIVRNCNCLISGGGFNISNKHGAIIFYKKSFPVRLMVINKKTDIEKCVDLALSQHFEGGMLKDFFEKKKIKRMEIDMNEKPIFNSANHKNEIDVGSCDRWSLLFSMLKGSYTESETAYGNYQSDRYEFIPKVKIVYDLKILDEHFEIAHECAFINSIGTRIIPIQKNSSLTKS